MIMKNMSKLYFIVVLLLTSALVGCGGGGGGSSSGGSSGGGGDSGGSGGGGSTIVRNFTSWSDVEPDSEYTLSGISAETSQENILISDEATLNFTTDSNAELDTLVIKTPKSTASYSTADGDNINIETGTGNPWDYQTFGIWMKEGPVIGAISAGAPTSVNAVPTTGTATYTGNSTGIYNDSNDLYQTVSGLNVDADFANRTLDFKTSGTVNMTDNVSMSELDMDGTLNINANKFTGSVSTKSGLTGDATGQFYGPAAEELGGVFATSNGNKSYIGAFGGSK